MPSRIYSDLIDIPISRIFQISWKVFQAQFRYLFWPSLVIFIIYIIRTMLETPISGYPTSVELKNRAVIKSIFNFIKIFSVYWYSNVITKLTSDYFSDHPVFSFWGYLMDTSNAVLKLILKLLFTTFINALLYSFGTALLIFPGVAVMIYSYFSHHAVVLRDRWGPEAILYSFWLVKNQWWKIFGTVLLISIYATGPLLVLFVFLLGSPSWAVSAISVLIQFFFSLPYAFIATTVLFLKLDAQYWTNKANSEKEFLTPVTA